MGSVAGILGVAERVCYHATKQASWAWVTSAVTAAEVALSYKQETSHHLANHIVDVRALMSCAHVAAVVIDTFEMVYSVSSKVVGLSFRQQGKELLSIVALEFAIGAITGLYLVARMRASQVEVETPPGVQIDTIPHGIVLINEASLVVRIALNGVRAYSSSEDRSLRCLNIAALIYSLFQARKILWFRFARCFSMGDTENNLTYTYILPLVPSYVPREGEKERCIICRSKSPVASLYGHTHASYHYSCLTDSLLDKGKRWETVGYLPVGETRFVIWMPQQHLLQCPCCRAYPFNHTLSAHVSNSQGKEFATELSIQRDTSAPLISDATLQKLGRVCSLVAAVFKAMLMTMQLRHPELTWKIKAISTVLILFDGVLFGIECSTLASIFKERCVAEVSRALEADIQSAQEKVNQLAEELRAREQAVSEEVESGNALRVINGVIPLSEKGMRLIGHEESEEWDRALLNGDIITRDDPIPLTREAVSLIQEWKQAIQAGKNLVLEKGPIVTPLFLCGDQETQALAGQLNAAVQGGQIVFRKQGAKSITLADGGIMWLRKDELLALTAEAKERIEQYSTAYYAEKDARKDLAQAQSNCQFKKQHAIQAYESNWRKRALINVATLGALSMVTPALLNFYWRPVVDWTAIVHKLGVSGVRASWSLPPLWQYGYQSVIVAQLAQGLTLAAYADRTYAGALVALARSVALINAARQPWIQLHSHFSDSRFSSMAPTSIIFKVLLSEPYEEMLKAVCGRISTWFQESMWSAQWNYSVVNGVEVGRKLISAVSNLPLESPGCGSFIWDHAVSLLQERS